MKCAFTLIEVVVVITIILVAAVLLMPLMAHREPEHSRRVYCQSNLKLIGLGFLQYVQEYDNRFPPAHVTSTTGWANVLQPYIKSTRIFQCPSTQNSTQPLTDYFYNRRLSRLGQEKVQLFAQTILAGEGNDDALPWASLSQLPSSWVKDEKSPAWRHFDGAEYLFADGHVKWSKADKISTAASQKATPTFAIR